MLNIHGGGFIAGSAARDDADKRRLACELDAVILLVDYRLAPETPYPGPPDDCFAALLWLRARVDDLSGLPPTFLATGSIDLFAQEDVAFATALMRAGVPVELHIYPSAYHGCDMMAKSPVARAAQRDETAALRHALGAPFAS